MNSLARYEQIAYNAETIMWVGWTIVGLIQLAFVFTVLYWIGRFVKALELKWNREHERAFTRTEADRLNAPFKR